MATAQSTKHSYPNLTFEEVKEITGYDGNLSPYSLGKWHHSRLGKRRYDAIPASELAKMTMVGSGDMAIKLAGTLLKSELIRPVNENAVNRIGRVLVDHGFDRTSPLTISLYHAKSRTVRAGFSIHSLVSRVGEGFV